MSIGKSTLIAHANGQGDKVPQPGATLGIAEKHANELLPLAVNCLNQAMDSAVQDARLANKVFSPQNWLKGGSCIQGERLVASTIIGMLPGIGAQSLVETLKISPQQFGLRWSAD